MISRLLGTSTDVSRYAGQYEHVFESMTAGVTIQAPRYFISVGFLAEVNPLW